MRRLHSNAFKSNSKPRDVVEILRVRQTQTLNIVKNLETSDAPEAVYLAESLRQTVADENLFVGYGITNSKTGEKFDGFDALVMVASRLSLLYIREQSRRARRRAVAYLSKIARRPFERWLMITLSMPRLRNCDFVQTKEVFNDALRRFRQSKYFRENVRGGIKSEEFTLGKEFENEQREWRPSDGFHIHAHLVVYGKWLKWEDVGETWGKCLSSAFDRFGIEIDIPTLHKRPVVHLRHVTAKGTGKKTVSFEYAITEACKYVTKGSNFEKLPVEEILKIEKALRGRRLIEPLGEANQRKGSQRSTLLADLKPEINSSESEAPVAGSVHYLDTPNTIESLNLRKRCLHLIESGKIESFKKLLAHHFEKRRHFRRRHLAMTFPEAEFFTLSGDCFTFRTFEVDPKPYRHLKLVKTKRN
jgi:hypothetical protein